MSEVIPFPPKPASKTIEEETAEFLKLLERIRSSSEKSKIRQRALVIHGGLFV